MLLDLTSNVHLNLAFLIIYSLLYLKQFVFYWKKICINENWLGKDYNDTVDTRLSSINKVDFHFNCKHTVGRCLIFWSFVLPR